MKDHPRVCGEHSPMPLIQPVTLGSSPRMRGTRRIAHEADRAGRIIPAYAGNTTHTRNRMSNPRDHPRVCGEHISNADMAEDHTGSSPRMRGTRLFDRGLGVLEGIIPAYAGNTRVASLSASIVGDHPRVCGEHEIAALAACPLLGSSPRMRGTP